MKPRRWMKTVIAEAKKCDTQMAWSRKDRPKRGTTPPRLKAAG